MEDDILKCEQNCTECQILDECGLPFKGLPLNPTKTNKNLAFDKRTDCPKAAVLSLAINHLGGFFTHTPP